MSIKCVAERYTAYRVVLRISTDSEPVRPYARELAGFSEKLFGTDGSNVTFGESYWKGDIESGAAVEIVTRNQPTNEQLELISYHCNVAIGLTCFATVDETTAFELYELSE